MNVTQFAKHIGVSRPAIRNAIRRERLARSVRRDARGRVDIDPVLGVREWEENRQRLPTGKENTGHTALSRASAEEKRWRARLAKLEYEKRASELIEARAVEAQIPGVLARCRETLLQIPATIGRRCPHLSVEQLVAELVDEALEAMQAAMATSDDGHRGSCDARE